MTVNTLDSVTQIVRTKALRENEELYAVIDGAQDLEMAFLSKQIYDEAIHSLFEGDMTDALADVAPYFTHVDLEKDYLERWQEKLGNNVGILFTTANNDNELLIQHLREIFVVTDESEQEYFFRFYDPRVIRTFLSTCNEEELRQFFGPISSFLVESERPNGLIQYSIVESRLSVSEFEFSLNAS